MTPEELLKHRYKVIADYPFTNYNIGDILLIEGTEDYKESRISFFEQYPLMFQPLQWWEERKVEDMPDYLKDIGDSEMFRIVKWLSNSKAEIFTKWGKRYVDAEHFLPSTKEEYEQYLNKTKS